MKKLMIGIISAMMIASLSASQIIEELSPDICRVREGENTSLLNRYGIIEKLSPKQIEALPPAFPKPEITKVDKGYKIELPLVADEALYGLGDSNRNTLNRRGEEYLMKVVNISSYIPIPMLISSRGWGILVNETRTHKFDVGKSKADRLIITAQEGTPDIYLFTGKDFKALLETYTRLTGRPALLPAFAYGFAYVAHEKLGCDEILYDAFRFREFDFPCDVYGLEPGWMRYFYDSTTKKAWCDELTPPSWTLKQKASDCTWQGALKRMHFKLSLWLCMDYDLFTYEEALADGKLKELAERMKYEESLGDGAFVDQHISTEFDNVDRDPIPPLREVWADARRGKGVLVGRTDGLTGRKQSGAEPWFDHLKKFVDQGARCFKLDGGWQVCDFKDRVWAGHLDNDLAHNVYPLIYDKQMAKGYEDYTGNRAMVYSAGGYAGLQRYVATWAGDTGGGLKTLVSTLNLGASGHPNQSCDMTVRKLESVHYCIFAPWSQQNNWTYFQQPWYRDREEFETLKKYVQLRYRLFPYIYSTAIVAAKTGWPMARPLAFVYPEVKEYANEYSTYMFGDNFLVSAFSDHTVIPAGDWYDYFTGEKVTGPCVKPVTVDATKGGGLYVKAGAIIPMWPLKQHLEKGWNETVELHVWPGADSTFALYEDDGDTLGYRQGEGAFTELTHKNGVVKIGETKGSFKGMPTMKRDFKIINEVK